MAYRYEIMPEAERDLWGIEAYLHSYSRSAEEADAVIDELIASFRGLCVFPFRHAVYRTSDGFTLKHEYRSYVVRHYKVFYVADRATETVCIYRVRHELSDFTAMEYGRA